jgi:hypothetical protein
MHNLFYCVCFSSALKHKPFMQFYYSCFPVKKHIYLEEHTSIVLSVIHNRLLNSYDDILSLSSLCVNWNTNALFDFTYFLMNFCISLSLEINFCCIQFLYEECFFPSFINFSFNSLKMSSLLIFQFDSIH